MRAYAVLNDEGDIRRHKLHGHLAIYTNRADAETSTTPGRRIVEIEIVRK